MYGTLILKSGVSFSPDALVKFLEIWTQKQRLDPATSPVYDQTNGKVAWEHLLHHSLPLLNDKLISDLVDLRIQIAPEQNRPWLSSLREIGGIYGFIVEELSFAAGQGGTHLNEVHCVADLSLACGRAEHGVDYINLRNTLSSLKWSSICGWSAGTALTVTNRCFGPTVLDRPVAIK